MGNNLFLIYHQMAGSQSAQVNSGETFACTMDGYTDMVEKIVALSLAVLTMAMTTFEAMLPTNIAKAVKYMYRFLKSSGSWVGFVIAALYYFSIEGGFGKELCEASGYGYLVIYYLNYALTFGQES